MSIEKFVIIKRVIQSFIILTIFLFLPTMRLKRDFTLAVARLPLWKQFDFFATMFKIIDESKKGKRDE